jgi:beta-lactamase superfamily II metal-dependent hydrolase
MRPLVVRAYNVKFGDAVLVSVPDRDEHSGKEVLRHVLIDVGNVLVGAGGDDTVFRPVIEDIHQYLDGRSVDLYVMTHEHLDHVQGLYLAYAKHALKLEVDYAWITASSAPDYYKRHPAARKRLAMMRACFKGIERYLAMAPAAAGLHMLAMMANNHPGRTSACVDYLRKIAKKRTHYVHRESRIRPGVHHPFSETKFTILAPEKDTSRYYGRLQPMTGIAIGEADDDEEAGTGTPDYGSVVAPPGVDPNALGRLLDRWKSGIGTNVLAIDRAANNTSIVFVLEWRGQRLLFAGDAERRSWQTIMATASLQVALKPVHFLKVGHHGSHNGTPSDAVLDRILPIEAPDQRKRVALVSTCSGTYPGVPHDGTLDRLRDRCDQVLSTADVEPGKAVEVAFEC